MQLGMKDAKISFCDIEENENPSMIMTYSKDNNKYVNVYQINDDNKVTYMAYKQPSEAEYLYNIEKENYNWYIHENSSTSDSYILLKNIADKLKNNSDKSEKSSNVNIAEIEADYTIKKDEAEITQKTEDGNKVTIKKFDQIFVKPEIKPNEQIDFNIDIKENDLKKSINGPDGSKTKVYTYKIGTFDFSQDIGHNYKEGIGLYDSEGMERGTYYLESETCITDGDAEVLQIVFVCQT